MANRFVGNCVKGRAGYRVRARVKKFSHLSSILIRRVQFLSRSWLAALFRLNFVSSVLFFLVLVNALRSRVVICWNLPRKFYFCLASPSFLLSPVLLRCSRSDFSAHSCDAQFPRTKAPIQLSSRASPVFYFISNYPSVKLFFSFVIPRSRVPNSTDSQLYQSIFLRACPLPIYFVLSHPHSQLPSFVKFPFSPLYRRHLIRSITLKLSVRFLSPTSRPRVLYSVQFPAPADPILLLASVRLCSISLSPPI